MIIEIIEIDTREKEKILQKKEDADNMCREWVEKLVSWIEASAVRITFSVAACLQP